MEEISLMLGSLTLPTCGRISKVLKRWRIITLFVRAFLLVDDCRTTCYMCEQCAVVCGKANSVSFV